MKTKVKYFALATIILTAALFGGCMMNQNNLAGKINGKPITEAVYMESYRAHYNNFQILNNRTPDNEEREQIKQLTWRNATKHVILTHYFKKYDIQVSQQEVLDSLRNNVPEYIRTSDKFMTKGAFDQKKYLQSLDYDSPENLQPLRQHYKDYLIPIMKLEKYLVRDELLTSKEKKLSTKILQSRAAIDWIVLDPQTVEPIVTEEDIAQYYRKNLTQFQREPFYSIGVTSIRVTPSAEDMSYSRILADSLFADIMTGSSPETAILKHNNDMHMLTLKNSGFLRIEVLDAKVYGVLSTMDEGSYSAPQETDTGIVIYQMVQRTKSMVNFNSLMVPYTPSEASRNFQYPLSVRLAQLARSMGLSVAAEEMDAIYDRTGKLQLSDLWSSDAKLVDAVLLQIKDKPTGYISDPVYSDEAQAWYVVQLLENQINASKSLDEVRDTILQSLTQQKRQSMTQHLAGLILAGQADIPANATKINTPNMTFSSRLEDSSTEQEFFRTMKHFYAGERQEFHAIDFKIWIPFVQSALIDPTLTVSEQDITRIYTKDLSSSWFDEWMERKIDKAVVNIFID